MKRFVYMICMMSILLCSCGSNLFNEETETTGVEDISYSRLDGIRSNFSCLQFHNQLFYLTNEYDRFYILSEDGNCKEQIIPSNLGAVELTASNSYLYLYCEDMDDDIENGVLLIYDKNIELIKQLKLPFDRVFAKNNTIYAYRGEEVRTFYVNISNIANPYIECNYYMKESDLLARDSIELQDWEKFVLEDKTEMDGLILYRHNPNYFHSRAFYSSAKTIPMFKYGYADYILYCDGRFCSDETDEYVREVVDELYKLMKKKEPNFYVRSFEQGDTLYGVCNVYIRSAYMMDFYTQDIDYSFVFSYDSQNMKKVLEVEDLELVYSDGIHLLSHQKDGIYLSDLNLENQEKVFEWDGGIAVTVLDGVVMVEYDTGMYDKPKIEIKKLW